MERIWFEFKNLTATNSLVEIHMQGYNLASTAEGLYSSTEAIRLNKKNHRKYAIKLTQRVFVESDAVKDCRNYPYGGFASYKACDDHFLRQAVDRLAPGLVPVWLADDLDQVTTHMVRPQTLKGKVFTHFFLDLKAKRCVRARYVFSSSDNYRKYSTMMMGKQRSDCPLPCSTFSVEKKLLEGYSSEGTYISIDVSPKYRKKAFFTLFYINFLWS